MSYGYNPYSYQNPYSMPNYAQRGYAPQPQAQPTPMPQIQPQQMPTQAAFQPPMEMPVQDIRFVTSEEAKAFIVMPNTRVLLIDRQGGVAHLKTADNMGQSATQMFRFEPITQDGAVQQPQPQIDLSAYLRRDEIPTFGFITAEQYQALAAELDELKKMLSQGKGNSKSEAQKGGQ